MQQPRKSNTWIVKLKAGFMKLSQLFSCICTRRAAHCCYAFSVQVKESAGHREKDVPFVKLFLCPSLYRLDAAFCSRR